MSLPTQHDCHIFGSINGIDFDMVGGGKGDPHKGTLETTVRSTKGPLPFSPLILGPNLGYGYHQYTPFPNGQSPYQNAVHDGGYKKHRTFTFEDGGILSITFNYTYEGNKIYGEFQCVGTGFPDVGPVMTNALVGEHPNCEKLMISGANSIGSDNNWSFSTNQKGKYYKANVVTNSTFAKKLPADLEDIMPLFVFRKTQVKCTKTEITLHESEKSFSDL